MISELKTARRCGVPIVMIDTTDEPATIAKIVANTNGSPRVVYNLVDGYRPADASNESAAACAAILGDVDPVLMTDPVTALQAANAAPERAIVMVSGAHRVLDERYDSRKIAQAIQNLRGPYESTGRMIVLLAASGTNVPSDLAQDVYAINDELPNDDERAEVVKSLHNDAELPAPKESALRDAINATRGLGMYGVKQAVALSLTKEGLSQESLRNRWKQAINATPGLKMDSEIATMSDIGGLANVKEFAKMMAAGRSKINAVVRIDEIEKALAGSSGAVADSSGTSQSVLGGLLSYMEDEAQTGIIAVGVPGSGKSLLSKALGSTLNVPTIALDIGALKGGIVGQTEANTRKAFQVLRSLTGGKAYWIASCNGAAQLPIELRRRFTQGLWFFDLPDSEERKSIWKIILAKYPDVDKKAMPDDEGWTGAEIRNCVRLAYDLKCDLVRASRFIVPVAKSSPESIDAMRRSANNRYLSASYDGYYSFATSTSGKTFVKSGRKITLDEGK